MTKLINLYGGPGIGKSTTAAKLFACLKDKGYKVELVTEYAKDLTYEGDVDRLSNQLLVSGEQIQRVQRLAGKVDIIINDSPILLGGIYFNSDFKQHLTDILAYYPLKVNECNILLKRTKPYAGYGRTQTYEAACGIDTNIKELLDTYKDYVILHTDEVEKFVLNLLGEPND